MYEKKKYKCGQEEKKGGGGMLLYDVNGLIKALVIFL